MLIVADQNIPLLEQTFAGHGELCLRPGRRIARPDLEGADALLVKSITRVDRQLLRGTRVRFVGTATIGFDHLDTEWLEQNGIAWASAPGCNADAAAQYTLAMILLACQRLDRSIDGLGAGIVGRGNVGSRVQKLLAALGVPAVACDPPLAARGIEGLVPLEQALAQAVVCLHVPLTKDGPCPTLRMINRDSLALIPRGALLVNTARGHVVDGPALHDELRTARLQAALDVWPGEPNIDPRLLSAAVVATPHVAGYSEQGRRNGALMIYAAFCRWLGIPREPGPAGLSFEEEMLFDAGNDDVSSIVRKLCHVEEDDRAMRELLLLAGTERPACFDRLRRDYPLRSDFSAWRITGGSDAGRETLRGLGFRAFAPPAPGQA